MVSPGPCNACEIVLLFWIMQNGCTVRVVLLQGQILMLRVGVVTLYWLHVPLCIQIEEVIQEQHLRDTIMECAVEWFLMFQHVTSYYPSSLGQVDCSTVIADLC